MNKQDNKYQPQRFRESEEFKQLQAIVHERGIAALESTHELYDRTPGDQPGFQPGHSGVYREHSETAQSSNTIDRVL
jgi:hypothetical protein